MGGIDTKKIGYEALATEARELYARRKAFHKKRMAISDDYKHLENYLSGWGANYEFPEIEKDINELIGKWNPATPLSELENQLSTLLQKIEELSKSIEQIRKQQQKLSQLPDRNNRRNVADKLSIFLRNAPTIHLAALDKVLNEVVPQVQQLIKEVFKAFDRERNKVSQNKRNAQLLQDRIASYSTYVDKYNLRSVCEKGTRILAGIIQNPDAANPDSDSEKIQNVKKALDQCDASFQKEEDLYRAFADKLDSCRHYMWCEDYYAIENILDAGPRHNDCSPNGLKSNYDAAVKKKGKDLSQFKSQYSPKILNEFEKEIIDISNNFCERNELDKLRVKIKARIKADKIKMYKIIGGVLAGIIFIIILVTIPWVKWVVLGIVVLLVLFTIYSFFA